MKILFCLDAGSLIGAGHLIRCKVLAKELIKNNVIVEFFVGGMRENEITDNKLLFMTTNENLFCNSFNEITEKIKNRSYEIVVIDTVHAKTLEKLNDFLSFLKDIKRYGAIAIIDSFGKSSLRNKCKKLEVNTVIAPYVGEKKESSIYHDLLAGPEYYIIDPEYSKIGSKKNCDKVENILVTCGGADTKNISCKILSGINQIRKKQISIKCIIGPFFSKINIKKIKKISNSSQHEITLIFQSESLLNYMNWCDIAIATSGLTKYELAAGGVPSILISIDEEHHQINQEFMKAKSAINLGNNDTVSDLDIKDAIELLIKDKGLRTKLISKSENVVDSYGADRLCRYLIELGNRIKETA